MKTLDDQSRFTQALLEKFPDIATTGEVTRKQITEIMNDSGAKFPAWILENRISRGVYSISPGVKTGEVLTFAAKENSGKSTVFADKTLVPVRDKNYVVFGNYKDVDTIVKSGIFYPVYIAGPTGNGKSMMVEQACAANRKPLIRINLNAMTDEEQLIGSKTLVDGNIEIVEGPVLIAMRTGATLLLDEIDAGGANVLLCLQPILEGKPFYFKLKNELIVPAPGFNIFATANTKGKGSDGQYIGTNILNEAFLERFAVTLNQDYPSAAIEKKIVLNLMEFHNCVDEEFAETLVKWSDTIRRTYADGGVDELITTRRLTHVIRTFSIFKNKVKAIELCCNRFDDVTRACFIDLFKNITPDPVNQTPTI